MRKEAAAHKLPPRYDGTCRRLDPAEAARRVASGEKHVIRFRMPREGSITVRDRLRGAITVENRQLDDYIIVKSDGLALYHLAAMVDDHLMEITHVIRGSEWLPTFPLHAHIIRALGWKEPEFVHLSLFLRPSGKGKMSKRESADVAKDGYSIFVKDLKDLGYTPEGVVNWIALMGWSLDDRTEFFTLADLVKCFSLERLNPSPAAINFTKLDHFNGLHIRTLRADELARRVRPHLERAGLTVDGERLLQVVPLIRERMVTLDDASRWAFFFREDVARTRRRWSQRTSAPSPRRSRRAVWPSRGAAVGRARDRGAAAARPRRGVGPDAEPGVRHPARRGDRAERQPAAVREHGGARPGDGAGQGASGRPGSRGRFANRGS
jgi:glutamyl-tRNA synthetase